MQHLLTGFELDQDGYHQLIELAQKMKANPKEYRRSLDGMSAALLFEKPSLRTRTTFELAMFNLGGHGVYLDLGEGELGVRESVADYARNLSRWVDCLIGRVFLQSTLEELAQTGSVSVINALSDLYHPAQAMADFMTIKEHIGKCEGVKIAYLGDGNNVANSLLVASAHLGAHITCFCPLNFGPDIQIFNKAQEVAKRYGAKLEVSNDLSKLQDYAVLYTDTWVSMGDNTPLDTVKKIFMPYQINAQLVQRSNAQIVMHCLPAHRGYEITDEVMDGDKSVVFDEAENRLHIHMALLHTLLS